MPGWFLGFPDHLNRLLFSRGSKFGSSSRQWQNTNDLQSFEPILESTVNLKMGPKTFPTSVTLPTVRFTLRSLDFALDSPTSTVRHTLNHDHKQNLKSFGLGKLKYISGLKESYNLNVCMYIFELMYYLYNLTLC